MRDEFGTSLVERHHAHSSLLQDVSPEWGISAALIVLSSIPGVPPARGGQGGAAVPGHCPVVLGLEDGRGRQEV